MLRVDEFMRMISIVFRGVQTYIDQLTVLSGAILQHVGKMAVASPWGKNRIPQSPIVDNDVL